jgi:hypothetical protein
MWIGIKRNILLGLSFGVFIFFSSAVWCAEFTADVALDQNGSKYGGKAYVKDGNVRYELTTEAGKKIIIYRADFGAQWTIFPEGEVYDEEWDYDDDDFIVPEMNRRLGVVATEEPLGTKDVAGVPCDVLLYRFADTSQGTLIVYRSRDLDYPIKIELTRDAYYLTKNYRNIKKDSLEDSLFELPKGYSMLK